MKQTSKATIGYALCGSFCTFSRTLEQMETLVRLGYDVIPFMSETAYSTDTRFGRAEDFIQTIENICGHPVIHTIAGAEPVGPKKMVDLLLVAPCTGNTLAKLSWGVTDTSVTMAVKSSLRIGLPVVLCLATNDGLGASAQNFGRLMNTKHMYFVPLQQDDPILKPNSLVADFTRIPETVEAALDGRQVEPVLF